MNCDYLVYVHFLNSSGNIAFQQDHKPVGGVYPTSLWQAGDTVREEYVIMVPPELPPGQYRIRIGMWDPSDKTQLSPQHSEEIILDGVRVLSNKSTDGR